MIIKRKEKLAGVPSKFGMLLKRIFIVVIAYMVVKYMWSANSVVGGNNISSEVAAILTAKLGKIIL